MNIGSGGGATTKKGTVCRYFVTTGTCFYGDTCQFLHTNNFLPAEDSLRLRDHATSNIAVRGPEGAPSPVLDPLYQAYVPPTGLPSESKLQTYMNATSRSLSPSLEKPKVFVPSVSDTRAMTHAMAALSLDTALKGSVHTPNDLMSMSSIVNHGRLTHSRSSPSFSEYSVRSTLPSSSPFGQFGGDSLSVASSGLHTSSSPGISPENSPLIGRRNRSPLTVGFLGAQTNSTSSSTTQDQFASSGVVYTESLADPVAYFASEEGGAGDASHGYILPEFHSYPGNPSHIEHLKPKANAPSFFLPDELRMDILHRQSLTMATVNPQDYPDLPAEVDNYHNLCPLDPVSPNEPAKSATFGFVTSVYKAANVKTGVHYCLRRIAGVRLPSSKCMAIVDTWKKLQHSNIVHLREVFTTKAFNDNSLVFVYDYHPGADTLMNQYFSQTNLTPANGYSASLYNNAENLLRSFGHTKGTSNLRQHAGLLPESLIWAYIVQLSSALRTIHAAGLACRAFEPSKILLTGKSRLRLNCCGIFDVLNYETNQLNSRALTAHFQQEDLLAFGKVVLALACNSLVAVQRENLQSSLELVARNYSVDLRNLIMYLLSNQSRPRNINDIMPMIGARFYTQLDAAQMRSDVIENELTKEVENGRLFRLVVKLGIINERPEFNMDPSWSETGDRYLLKLFRDYLFHQVTEDGRPWIDMAHIVQCLNKLDAGVPEKICLTSRDEQNVLVVSYTELKQCFESAIGEVLAATSLTKQARPS